MNIKTLHAYINEYSSYQNFDSGIVSDINNEVNSILLCLDFDIQVCEYAKKENINTIIVHHAIGRYYYEAYKGIDNKLQQINDLNFSANKYKQLLRTDKINCFLSMRNANKVSELSLLSSYQLSCLDAHHVPDFLVQQELLKITTRSNDIALLVESIKTLLEDSIPFPKEEAVVLFSIGNSYKKIFIELCFVSAASPILQKALLQDGIDLLITTSTTVEVIDYAIENSKSIILLNHIPFDIYGMQLLKRKLEDDLRLGIVVYEESRK